MSDVECPYCGNGNDICHDDGQGYEEDTPHHQGCIHCDKEFVFYTQVSFSYEAKAADCLNGAEHDWRLTHTRPVFFTKMRCSACGEKRKLTPEEKVAHGLPERLVL